MILRQDNALYAEVYPQVRQSYTRASTVVASLLRGAAVYMRARAEIEFPSRRHLECSHSR